MRGYLWEVRSCVCLCGGCRFVDVCQGLTDAHRDQPFSSMDFYSFGRTLGEGAYGKVIRHGIKSRETTVQYSLYHCCDVVSLISQCVVVRVCYGMPGADVGYTDASST